MHKILSKLKNVRLLSKDKGSLLPVHLDYKQWLEVRMFLTLFIMFIDRAVLLPVLTLHTIGE